MPSNPFSWLVSTARHKALAGRAEFEDYHLLPAARADLLRRAGRFADAAREYAAALQSVGNEAERRYLARRLREVRAAGAVSTRRGG